MTTQALHHKLAISELRKTYGPVTAVARVSLDVGEGEFVTLLGPSGSGKTTLLMMVAGLTWPDSGEVRIDGRPCTYLPSHKRDIGMVFQNYALFPHLTVYENVAFPLRMRRMSNQDIARKVRQALETVQLPDVGERETSALSGGQQQRIALARCIVYEPSIILMDEPLGALDKKLREEMQLEIKDLHKQIGITVLYVTHDQEEAMVMSDKICLFNAGSIEQVGSPEEMYFAPRSKFAASFLGESNILSASLKGTDNHRAILDFQGSATVEAPLRFDVQPGQNVAFMVRPESIAIADEVESGQNVIEGVVRDRILTGGVTKYFVEVAGKITVSASSLTMRSDRGHSPGDRVRLGWSIHDTVVLHGDGAAHRAPRGQ